MNENPKIAWDNTRTLKDGYVGHRVEQKTMIFRNSDRESVALFP